MAKKSSIEREGMSDFAKSVVKALAKDELPLVKTEKKLTQIQFGMTDPLTDVSEVEKSISDYAKGLEKTNPLVKAVMNQLNGPANTIERLAFEIDPTSNNNYATIYRPKSRLLPNDIIKRISIQDDLVASIIQMRANQVSAFGRPQPDRHSSGFRIDLLDSENETLDDREKDELNKKIAKVEKLLLSCGRTDSLSQDDTLNFSQYLYITTRDILRFGRLATEAVWDRGNNFHYFKPIDAGTIYRTVKQTGDDLENIRKQAIQLLQQLNCDPAPNQKFFDVNRFQNDEYSWVQVVNDRPLQVFGEDECLVHNFYPVTDVELDNYPLTPLDTVIAAVTTHINITTHNKLYFQSGRATRGMLVITSEDVNEGIVRNIKQQFNAAINSVSNSWRMPVFGLNTGDTIQWMPIDSSGRDMEFQYLSDTNARVILSAFQVSPEEIPGYTHLSRGTNSQALSESNNEYKLEAHRDVGIRPLLAQLQNFINARLLPLLDKELAKRVVFRFIGLDVDSAEKESARLQEDQNLHMTINDLLSKVDKKPIHNLLGGNLILNPLWNQSIAPFVTVGTIMELVFGVKGASKDPRFDYIRDQFYFQNLQMAQAQQVQQEQMAQQQQMMASGQMPQQPGQDPNQQDPNQQQQPQDQEPTEKSGDFTSTLDQLTHVLSKAEQNLTTSQRKLLLQERRTIENALKSWDEESKKVLSDAVDIAKKHLPAKLKK